MRATVRPGLSKGSRLSVDVPKKPPQLTAQLAEALHAVIVNAQPNTTDADAWHTQDLSSKAS